MRGLISFVVVVCLSFSLQAQEWKEDYQKKIDSVRRSVIQIEFENANTSDDPIEIRVVQKDHDFKWGTIVRINMVDKLTEEGFPIGSDHPYFNHFSHFNSVTVENTGKWQGWIQPAKRQTYAEFRNWLMDIGIANRGHGTIWESTKYNAVPGFILDETDTAVVRAKIKEHILDQMAELKDEVYELDLVNEPVHERKIVDDILDVESPAAERAKWHKWARAAAPDLPLVINEFDLFQSGNTFYEKYIAYVDEFRSHGGPVDMIGMQGHFFSQMPEVSELQNRLDQLKSLNLPMHITEFDMQGSKYSDMERVLYVAFAEPSMTGFTMWGAWDGAQWRDNGPLYDSQWNLKESGKAFFDLVHGKWKTDTTFTEIKQTAIHGYRGSYDIIVERNGKTLRVPVTLGTDTAKVNIDLSTLSNKKPSITILEETKPVYCQNNEISVGVSADDEDGDVEKINFYVNGRITKTVRNDTAIFVWSANEGTLNITVEAIDNDGAITSKEIAPITVVKKNFNKAFDIVYPNDHVGVIAESTLDLILDWPYGAKNISSVEVTNEKGDVILRKTEQTDTLKINTGQLYGPQIIYITVEDTDGCTQQESFPYNVVKSDGENVVVLIIKNTNHDAEESDSGDIFFTGDLDLGQKPVGLNFDATYLPYGAQIDSAFLQFSSDRPDQTGDIVLRINADSSGYPRSIGGSFDLTKRPKTEAFVDWSVETWENPRQATRSTLT